MPTPIFPTMVYSSIKFADPHKLSFYDIVVSITGTSDNVQPILVKGDFETIKKMLFDGEAVCGVVFGLTHVEQNVTGLNKAEITSFTHSSVLDAIRLYWSDNSDPMWLLSDNTISTTEPNGEDIAIGPTAPDPGKS